MNLLEWCMSENLISSRYECPKRGKDMVLRERKGTIDGYEWRCCTKGGESACLQEYKKRNPDGIKRSTPNVDNITAAAETVLKDGVPVWTAVQQFGV
ncbi:hypothetical protein TNCV_2928211 [Trichonephila clavipes]|nr:hypothetical protein TNCV_2928211 [Trichonephila clavipes]